MKTINNSNMKLSFSLEELCKLVKDREQTTVEIYPPNDFYGNATVLKQYATFPPDYQIKGAIEHGSSITSFGWDCDLNANLPALFCFSPNRYAILKRYTNKALFAVGPMINYAPYFLDNDSMNNEKQRLGKNLLVFAGHSTHWVDCNYNIEKLCEHIKGIDKDFDTVRICLYWKDILRGHADNFLKYGFECTTAGHIFDPFFLPRLKSIIELATITASNILGTHIGYCIFMKKPHYYYEDQIELKAESEVILKRDVSETTQEVKKLFRAFSILRDDITPLQKEITEKYWGISEIKSQKEMKEIFEITEDMYKRGPSFFMSNKKVLIEQAVDYLNAGQYERALMLLEQSLKVSPELPKLLYGKAIALARLDRVREAIDNLNKLLTIDPNNSKAQKLLDEISVIPKIELNNKESVFKQSDTLIVSYPRSGNTWMRLLISDVILQIRGFETETVLPIHQDLIIPDVHQKDIDDIDKRLKLPFRLIKTHWTHEKVRGKIIYLFRKPGDALSSYYYFHLRYPDLKNNVSSGIDLFVKNNLDEWCDHLTSYINAYYNGNDVLFISYESMHEDSFTILKHVFNFIKFPADDALFLRAIDNHSFEKHRANENLGDNFLEYFFRKGKVDGSKNELKEETIKYIEERAIPIYCRAKAIEDSQLQQLRISLKLSNDKLLNLGCGGRYHPAWTNVDFSSTGAGVIAHNLNQGIPFDDNSFDVVYHSHLLEHFPKSYAPIFLKECYRVLKNGGIIRVVVPDLEQIIRAYLILLEKAATGDEEAQKRYDWIMLELFDQAVRNRAGGEMLKYWEQNPMPAESFVIERLGSEVLNVLRTFRRRGNKPNRENSSLEDIVLDAEAIGKFRLSGEIHQWMYDRYSLKALLYLTGFKDLTICHADESQIPLFNSYLLDIESNGRVRKPDSLFMEGKVIDKL